MASPRQKKQVRVLDESKGYRIMKNISLPSDLWAEVDVDARRSGRSSVRQVGAILSGYYNRDYGGGDDSWKLLAPESEDSATPVIFVGKSVMRNVYLPWPVWDALAEDANRCRRSLVGQLELILRTYYGGDPGYLDKDYLAFLKVRISAPEPKVNKLTPKRRAAKSRR
jgi:hypothetical protein